jgi:hypothetical protein
LVAAIGNGAGFPLFYLNPTLVLPLIIRLFAVPIVYLFLFFVRLGFAQASGGFWSSTDISPLGLLLLIAIILGINYLIAALIADFFKRSNHEKIGFYLALGIWLLGGAWLAISISQDSRITQREAQLNAACERCSRRRRR